MQVKSSPSLLPSSQSDFKKNFHEEEDAKTLHKALLKYLKTF